MLIPPYAWLRDSLNSAQYDDDSEAYPRAIHRRITSRDAPAVDMSSSIHQSPTVASITQQLADSYRDEPNIAHLDESPLPNSGTMVEIAQALKELLFPGYRERDDITHATLTEHAGDIVAAVLPKLTAQIGRALCYRDGIQSSIHIHDPQDDRHTEAGDIAVRLLQSLPEIRRVLATDVSAAHAADPAVQACDEIVICYPGLEAITVYRIAHRLHSAGVPIIPRMLTEWAHSRTGIDIHPGATIGESFFIDHGTGVVIGETAEIANNVTLYQGVTLGAVNFPRDEDGNIIRGQKRHPTLESGVTVYSNASVLGGNTIIGAKSVIGAGVSVMNREIPPGTLVTMEKPTLRLRDAA